MESTTAKSAILTQRYTQMQDWLSRVSQGAALTISPLAGDASFRRYFRVMLDNRPYVLMDAPPAQESVNAFVALAQAFKAQGIEVPVIHAQEQQQGFLLLSDLGDRLYLPELSALTADTLYGRALETLVKLQQCDVSSHYSLPAYDAALLTTEMQLFIDWYLVHFRQYKPSERERAQLANLFSRLVDNACMQPQVCVHRDYHSRNLLVCGERVGVLDFQDAVQGPVTYDLVSLLKDCYIAWPEHDVSRWVAQFYETLRDTKQIPAISLAQFTRWFDWMGLQRHLKCLGIFARLNFRDHKPGYLANLPQVAHYVRQMAGRYSEFAPLLPLLAEEGAPCAR